MARRLSNWIKGYIDYTEASEAPDIFHFWTAISVLAGALRRNVCINQFHFKWHANFYIVFVAPPGIVNKSSTIDIGIQLLKNVDDVNFGPESVTWQALITALANAKTLTEMPGIDLPVPSCCLTIPISELGTFLTVKDDKMVDHLVSLWDGKTGEFEKATKTQGTDTITNPWINLIAGTTPSWVTNNFPQYMIGGGFTSRTIFVYAEQKRRYVAYPALEAKSKKLEELRELLIEDLRTVGTLRGEFKLHPQAISFGQKWYQELFENTPLHLLREEMGGYLARKQTHVHKLAMILTVAKGNDLTITEEVLRQSIKILDDNENNFQRVFSHIGASPEGQLVTSMIKLIAASGKDGMSQLSLYNTLMLKYSKKAIEDSIIMIVKSGRVKIVQRGAYAFFSIA